MSEKLPRITKEYSKGKLLLFLPKTEKEAEFIQQKLINLGFKWPNGDTSTENSEGLKRCVKDGIAVSKGIFGRAQLGHRSGQETRCYFEQFNGADNFKIDQFIEPFDKLSSDQKQSALQKLKEKFPYDFTMATNPKDLVKLKKDLPIKNPPKFKNK